MSKLLEKINTEKKEMTLGEVVTFHRGYDLPITEIKSGPYPVVFSNGRKEYHSEFKVKGPGVFTGRSGSLGGMFYVDEDYWPHNTTLYVSDFHNNDPKYCYYFLSSFDFEKFNAGTGVPTLNRNHIHGIPVKVPGVPTQKKIAEILSAYDAKIENNNFIIKKLEATAQTLFDEWFVNFRFPEYEKTKFIDSEMGEIPEGWNVKNIKDIFTVILGGTPSREKPEYWNGSIPWINSGEVNKLRILEATEHITELGLNKSNARLIKSGATVLAITGATLGQVSRLEIDSTANQSVVGIFDEEDILNEYLYLYITNNILDLISGASGGAQQHINKQMVENYQILIPTEAVIKDFNKKIKSNFVLIKELFKENIFLKLQRDLLLKKLI